MNEPKYQLKASGNLTTYEFISDGPNGRIEKIVQFTPTNYPDVFNLGFGDKDKISGEVNDKVISNNDDSEKVLSTVISAVYAFTDKYPSAWVYATGSTKSRTRLYRMGISKYLKKAEIDFEIFGEVEKTWKEFRENVDYESFLVKRKV